VIPKALGAGLLLWLGAASCARSGLEWPPACTEEGATEPCANACGTGSATCVDGNFAACVVPEVKRDCRNTCGTGSQTCREGAWGECAVPPVDFPCSNACGDGVQRCESERLGYCQVPVVTRACSSACGVGQEACVNGDWQPCDAPQPNPPLLHTVIRDFTPQTNSDFELNLRGQRGDDPYIVGPVLAADDTPVYSDDPRVHTTTASTFAEWYHDSPASIRIDDVTLQLEHSTDRPGFFVYDDEQFFPIDGRGFGNYLNAGHNYHFTLTAELTFRYSGGEIFSFTGDDDMWVFVNRHLAIDLGGLHERESGSVSLDAHAAEFGITPGDDYLIAIFFAERHTIDSNFEIETSVADRGSCP
jgi:fibro-slime domain-containing protein